MKKNDHEKKTRSNDIDKEITDSLLIRKKTCKKNTSIMDVCEVPRLAIQCILVYLSYFPLRCVSDSLHPVSTCLWHPHVPPGDSHGTVHVSRVHHLLEALLSPV